MRIVAIVRRDLTDADLERVLVINEANVPAVGSSTIEHLRHLVAESSIALVSTTESSTTESSKIASGTDASREDGTRPIDDASHAEIAGFCIVFGTGADYDSVNYRWFMGHHPTTMYLDRVAFDDRFRKRGLGTDLYAEVDRRIRRLHPDTTGLTLEVNIDPPNEPSLAFHRKLGFVEVGRQMSKGIEVSLMHRPL